MDQKELIENLWKMRAYWWDEMNKTLTGDSPRKDEMYSYYMGKRSAIEDVLNLLGQET